MNTLEDLLKDYTLNFYRKCWRRSRYYDNDELDEDLEDEYVSLDYDIREYILKNFDITVTGLNQEFNEEYLRDLFEYEPLSSRAPYLNDKLSIEKLSEEDSIRDYIHSRLTEGIKPSERTKVKVLVVRKS